MSKNKICPICISDYTFPNFIIKKNICNYCIIYNEINKLFPISQKNKKEALIIKKRNKNSKYDVIVGISGGRDSTYLMYYAKKILKLRVLAIHFNDGFSNPVAGENMSRITKTLKVDFKIYTSDWKLSKDIKISFLKACVPDIETGTDIGIASALYAACYNYNVKDILIGQSFRTEGISPLLWNFLDGKYVETIQKKFGNVDFPDFNPSKICFNLTPIKIAYYALIKGIKVHHPFYYIKYNKPEISKFIIKKLKWKPLGAHYYDDLYQPLMFDWYKRKFNIDRRKFNYSALIRDKQLSRNDALKKIKKNYIKNNEELLNLSLKRLGISRVFYEKLINNKIKNTFMNFKTSYDMLRKIKFLIKFLCRINIIPPITYYKYFKL
jgi:tRNA(Ile)-lysidine synthase TilS/MesJ